MTEDLYSIVSNAHKSVESDTKAFYGTELSRRGVILADPPVASGATPLNGNVNANETKMPVAVEAWRNSVRDGGSAASRPDVVMAEPATLAQATL